MCFFCAFLLKNFQNVQTDWGSICMPGIKLQDDKRVKKKKKGGDRFWLEVPGEMTRWWGIQSGSGWENLEGGQLNGRRGCVRLLIWNWWTIVKLCASTKQDSVLNHHAGHTQIPENISRHQESWVQVTVSVSELFSPFSLFFFLFIR